MKKKAGRKPKMMAMEVEMEESKDNGVDEWKVRDGVDTLLKAEEIKADKKLMPLVQKELSKKHKALMKISSIQDMRDAYQDMEEEGE